MLASTEDYAGLTGERFGSEDPNPAEDKFSSNVGLPEKDGPTDDKYYAHKVIVDGNTYPCLKLGTGSVRGIYTTPALGENIGNTLALYGAGWNGESMHLVITVNNGGTINGAASAEIDCAGNSGVKNSSPYTVTFSDDDYYTFELEGLTPESTLTFSTTEEGFRGIITGVNILNQ